MTTQEYIKQQNITEEEISDYKDNMPSDQYASIFLYRKGRLMKNGDVKVFQMFGTQYTNNFNRKKKYCFDHPNWEVETISLFEKLIMIATGEVKVVKGLTRKVVLSQI